MRALALAAVIALFAAGPARADYPGCVAHADDQHAAVLHPERSSTQTVSIPGPYTAQLFAPTPFPAAGLLATAVVIHGAGGTPCSLWWLGRMLAGHGWIVVSVYAPKQGDAPGALTEADAVRAAVAYTRAPDFPYAGRTDNEHLALAGHSLGASAIGLVQGDTPGISTIVALDNLKRYAQHDPGSAVGCSGTPAYEDVPTVPALAFASNSRATSRRRSPRSSGERSRRAAASAGGARTRSTRWSSSCARSTTAASRGRSTTARSGSCARSSCSGSTTTCAS